MEVKITCQYCGHKVIKQIHNQSSLEGLKCDKCGDKNLIVKDLSKDKINYYAGAPEFPDEVLDRKYKEDNDLEDRYMPGNGYPWSTGGE